MEKKLSLLVDKAIEASFYLLFIFVPLVMTPWNFELFEFNKMLLVYLLTVIILAFWLVKMILARQIIFRRTFMDLPLVLFLLSQVLATIFSIDRHTSLWGYYSRSHGSLFSTLAYLALYWAFVTFMSRKKALSLLRYALVSAALVAGYGILERFGIDAQYWVQDVQNRVFSSLGQPNWLAAYLAALFFLPFALKEKFSLSVRHGLVVLFYLCLLYTKSRSGLIGFGLAYLFYWAWLLIPQKSRLKEASGFIGLTLVLIALTLLIGTPWTPSLSEMGQEEVVIEEASPIPLGGTESGEIRKIVWQGALEVWRHHPLLGTGVETFAYSYYWYRPREHNDVSEWDFLYNKAHNEYLNYAATSGTLGLLAYLGVIGTFFWWSFKQLKKKRNSLLLALLAGYLTILVTNFFGFSVVIVGLFFFLFPALAFVLLKDPQPIEVKETQELNQQDQALLALIGFLLLLSLYSLLRFWYADTLFARGEKLNQTREYDQALAYLQKAVYLRDEPFYHDEFSQAAANLAVIAFDQGEASLSAELIEIAIEESDQALAISPYQINFWKNRTRVFYTLAEVNDDYNQEALITLLKAAELAPTDAKLSYNLALMYGRLGQIETAIQTLEKTIALKPDYRNARYALALFYEQKGQTQKAKEQLEYILEKINPEDEEVKLKLGIR